MIQVEHLTKRYAGKTAIHNLNFQVNQGEIVGFLGPNGAGKSTTMRILAGFLPPTSGCASVAGYNVFENSVEARSHLGYMPEDVPLYREMRVREYLSFRGALKGLSRKKLKQRLEAVTELCSLTDVSKKLISTLSKGYRQRVGLADALIHEPDLLILDEPTIGLDPNQIRQVRQLIRELSQKHTILLSTHILSEVSATCGRVIIINNGEILADDTPADLVKKMRTAGRIRLEINPSQQNDAIEVLKKVPGVREVVLKDTLEDQWQVFLIRVEATTDLREELAHLAHEKQWRLRELTNTHATLENVFVELTHADDFA